MADEASTIDAALKELAALGRRIAELASTFESRRAGSSAVAERPADDGPADAKAGAPVAARATAADVAPPDACPRAADAAATRPPLPRRRQRIASGGNDHRALVAADDDRAPRAEAARAAFGPLQRRRSARGGRKPRRRMRPWPWRLRPTAPMLVSTGLHVAVLLGLALVFVAREAPPPRLSISLPAGEEEPLEELAEVALEPLDVAPTDALDPAAALPDLAALMPEPLTIDAPVAVAPQPAVDARDAAGSDLNLGDLLAVLGDGGGEGGAEGGGGGGGGGPPPEGTFFGTKGTGRTALFMCDNSASYLDGGFQAVLLELSRAVALMKPAQSFHVVFFSDAAYPLFHPEGVDAFLPATPENKRRLDLWLGTVELCIGGQGIRGAADLALALEPDVIYFLSDGDHAESVIDRMVALPLGDTVVHTFCMQADVRDKRTGFPDPRKVADQQQRNLNLARIAEAHGGTATPVLITPQAALAASVRPVRKNRTRGTVWGTNLPIAP